jgi:nucleoid-associated protein YgaU
MGRVTRVRAAALAGACVVIDLALFAHRPGRALVQTEDQTGLVVAAAAWIAWVLTAYLVTGVGVSAATYLRHRGGWTTVVDSATPQALRRVVERAVGASAAAVVVALIPAAAYADGAPPAPAVATGSPLDWPGLAAPAPSVALVSPAPRRASSLPRDELIVRPGDCLWSLTARRLGPGASPNAIAAAWPRLYAANRAAIGADPNLIHPGQRLVAPAPDERTTR